MSEASILLLTITLLHLLCNFGCYAFTGSPSFLMKIESSSSNSDVTTRRYMTTKTAEDSNNNNNNKRVSSRRWNGNYKHASKKLSDVSKTKKLRLDLISNGVCKTLEKKRNGSGGPGSGCFITGGCIREAVTPNTTGKPRLRLSRQKPSRRRRHRRRFLPGTSSA